MKTIVKGIFLTAVVVGLMATGSVKAQSQTPAGNEQALLARMQRLEDLEEIRTLLLEYGRRLDENDLVGFSKLYAKHGEWVGGSGSAKGPAAILALMQKNLVVTGKPGTYHLMSNFEIDVHGDTATAWSRWTFIIPNAEKKPSFSSGGHYEDALVREDGHWKFKRRVLTNNIAR